MIKDEPTCYVERSLFIVNTFLTRMHKEHFNHENMPIFDPLKAHFYIVKLGFTGVYIIFRTFTRKHRLWVLVRTASPRRF